MENVPLVCLVAALVEQNKTILLDKVTEQGDETVFEGYTINDGQHTHIKINDVDTLEGMPWHKFAQAYGLVKK